MRFAKVMAATVMNFALTGAAVGEVMYTVVDLGMLPGDASSVARSVNASGQVAGYSLSGSGGFRAFVWTNGVMTNLGTLQGGSTASAEGINDLGQVVGWSTVPGGERRAFLWEAGQMTDLGPDAAHGINNSGQIVGDLPYEACVWSNGTINHLGRAGGSSHGFAINDSGQVAGAVSTVSQGVHGLLWTNGTITDLGGLGGAYTDARAINASGQITGYSKTAAGLDHAFLWNAGTLFDLGTLPGDVQSAGHGINARGQIVGRSNTSSGYSRAFLWSEGSMADLNDLIDPSSGEVIYDARAINDNGWIVGWGNRGACLLVPVPEPTSLGLFALGALVLLRKR